MFENIYIYIYIYIYVHRKSEKKERYMFDGLFIFQCISTSIFCLNIKVFYKNYFCMRNDYDR